jgi:hypothetical protein
VGGRRSLDGTTTVLSPFAAVPLWIFVTKLVTSATSRARRSFASSSPRVRAFIASKDMKAGSLARSGLFGSCDRTRDPRQYSAYSVPLGSELCTSRGRSELPLDIVHSGAG